MFGEGILSEDLNDDKIGRVLDKLSKFGLNNLFLTITLKACQIYGIERRYSHLDSSSISVKGDYLIYEEDNETNNQENNEQNSEPIPIKIVRGHSKDKRPDLKQFLINLIVSGDSGVPLFLECGSGNDSDKAKFAQLICKFKKQVDLDSIFVADSALYSKDNIFLIKDLKWISRVPLSIKAAQFLVTETLDSEFKKTERVGYKAVEKESNYGGIKQKWIIIESQSRKESDLRQLSKKLIKDQERADSLVNSLEKKKYENRAEIKAVFRCEQKKIKYHNLVLQTIEETLEKKTNKTVYKVTIALEKKANKIKEEEKKAGRFILATNVLENLSPSGILTAYKVKKYCEGGFIFFKDPLFFAD